MSLATQPAIRRDLLTICWALSDAGALIVPILYEPGDACAHPPTQAKAILDRLRGLGPREIDDLRIRLDRLTKAGLRFWGDGAGCELCQFLHTLSSQPAD